MCNLSSGVVQLVMVDFCTNRQLIYILLFIDKSRYNNNYYNKKYVACCC